MGIIWGITNVAGIILASSAVPPQKVGGAIGLIYTNWNTSGVVVLALVTTIFTVSELNYMNHSLTSHKIENLTIEEHNQLLQSLGDPNQAQAIFSKFPSGMEREVVSLFKESFIYGYKNVMIFSFFYLLMCLGITLFLLRKDKEKELG